MDVRSARGVLGSRHEAAWGRPVNYGGVDTSTGVPPLKTLALPLLVIVTGLVIGVAIAVRIDWESRKRYADEHIYEAILEHGRAKHRKEEAIDEAQRREQLERFTERLENQKRAMLLRYDEEKKRLREEDERLDREGEVSSARLKKSLEANLEGPRQALEDMKRRQQETLDEIRRLKSMLR